MLLRCILRSPHHHWEKRVHDIRNNHSNGLGLLLDEAAGNEIWPVIQFLDCGFNALAQMFSYMTLVVDDCRDRED